MNSRLFRKAALDRLSSPEALDQIIQVSGSKSWAALVAILLVLGVALYWGFKGSLPTTVIGRGMIVRTGGVLRVVARGTGVARSIGVSVGQHVKADQVVARISLPSKAERLRGMRQALIELQRKRDRDLALRSEESQLAIDALARQRINLEREIREFQDQARLTEEQVTSIDHLFSAGIVARQQTIDMRQKLIEVQRQIEDRRAQLKRLDAQEFSTRSQVNREDSAMSLEIANVERDIATFEKELALEETVISPASGEIIELKVSPGSTVTEGEAILSLQPEVEMLEALVYVSASRAKEVRSGMEVQLSPSSVKREEYGFMRGRVTFVADYPATTAALMRNFQNELLVTSLSNSGPITEVHVTLERDAGSQSGFKWSSPLGPAVRISNGTLCETEIVTRRQPPITLLLPLLKDKLGLS
jgi:HlyD family secretion protein